MWHFNRLLLHSTQENYALSGRRTPQSRTPQSASRRRPMTAAKTPLRAIQPQGSVRRGSITASPATQYTPGPAYLLTPVSAHILDATERMSIDDVTGAAVVRRKLFDSDSPPPLPAPQPRSRHGHAHIPETFVSKKTSRSRLKRL